MVNDTNIIPRNTDRRNLTYKKLDESCRGLTVGSGESIIAGNIVNGAGTSTLNMDGNSAGTTGIHIMGSGRSITTTNETIGNSGTGSFTQAEGTNSVSNNLNIGLNTGSSGTYNLSGGNLSTQFANVCWSGDGVFNHSGGSFNVTAGAGLQVGFGDGNGMYNLSGTGSLTATNELIGNVGTGVFNQAGGTNTITSTLFLGSDSGSSGTYNISGGTLDIGGNIVDGFFSTSTLNVDGGTLNVGGGTINADFLNVGNSSGSNGSHTLESGESIFAGSETIGNSGTGVFNQTGGDKHNNK